MGLALKTVIVAAIGVNIQIFALTRLHNFKFAWGHQIICLTLFIVTGYILKLPFLWLPINGKIGFIIQMSIYCTIFMCITAILIARKPELLGSSEDEIRHMAEKVRSFLGTR